MSHPSPSIFARISHNVREYRRLRRARRVEGQAQLELPTFVINLERSPERRQYMVAHLDAVGLQATLIKAVDGKQLSLAEVTQAGLYDDAVCQRTFDRSLSLSEIACSMSHLSVYRRMVEENIDVALVSEDDAKFPEDAASQIEAILKDAPGDWELIQLRYVSRRFEPAGERYVTFPYENGLPVGATAYLLRASAARKILQGAYPIRYPADSMLGRAAQWDVTIYGTAPIMVDVNNIFPSSIQDRNWRFRLGNTAKRLLLKVLG